MPFHDLNKGLPKFNCDDFNFTIIGAGAVGILMAIKLSSKGKSVLLIESGHFEIDGDRQALNQVINTSKELTSAVWGRKRAIGGTTLAWGGQSLPFSELDFVRKEWVGNSGWPIKYQDIQPYYNTANAFMRVDELNYSTDIFPKIKVIPPNLDREKVTFHLSKWAPEPNFQKLYKDQLEKSVTVIYNATLKNIEKSNRGSVTGITVSSYSLAKFNLLVNRLIIAAGAIETARIVLLNKLFDDRCNNMAGKYFMEHPCCEVGEITDANNYQLQKHFNTHIWKRRKYSIRISSSTKLQVNEKILNCSASVLFRPAKDKFDPYAEIKSFIKKFDLLKLIRLSGSIPGIMESIAALYKDRFYFKINTDNKLVLMVEQEPWEKSHIGLSDQLDWFGMPKAIVNWDISYKTWESVCKMCETLKSELEKNGFGTVTIYSQFNLQNENWKSCLSDVNHHMGGCRMGETRETSIVDRDLKVWGFDNLFLCGCAVFPTSSHSNPTLTALALGARLVDKLLMETAEFAI